MRACGLVFGLILGLAAPAAAQHADTAAPAPDPLLEFFVGYQTRAGVNRDGVHLAPSDDQHRVALALEWNVARSMAIAVAVPRFGIASNGPAQYSIFAGPKIRFGARGRVLPFAEGLVGVRQGRISNPLASPRGLPQTIEAARALQVALSAGFDVRLTRKLLWRAVQVEDQYVGGSAGDNSVAVSTGVVFRFGARK